MLGKAEIKENNAYLKVRLGEGALLIRFFEISR